MKQERVSIDKVRDIVGEHVSMNRLLEKLV
jgi:hypothetical protein